MFHTVFDAVSILTIIEYASVDWRKVIVKQMTRNVFYIQLIFLYVEEVQSTDIVAVSED